MLIDICQPGGRVMIAYCGLVCTECPIYLAGHSGDEQDRERAAEKWNRENGWNLTAGDIFCDGCLATDGTMFKYCRECRVRACAKPKGVATCAHCVEYPCPKLDVFFGLEPKCRGLLEQIKKNLPQIREAKRSEAELLARIIRKSFLDVAERFNLPPERTPTHPSNCQPDWVEKAMAKGVTYYVMEQDGRAVGCVALENAGEGVFYLERLAVLPEIRRNGYGSMLVDRALNEARRMGAKTVQIGIIAEQTELENWYARRGFKTTGRKSFDHLPFTVAFMSLPA
jgi:GNAT superfamily N-acetyltransferase